MLSVIDARVDHWDIDHRPYECDFAVRDGADVVAMEVSLEPTMFDLATETRQHRKRDGVELLVDDTFCSTVAFVGTAPMQRMLYGGDFVSGDVVIRPAVVVDSGSAHCDVITDVAVAAAGLYG